MYTLKYINLWHLFLILIVATSACSSQEGSAATSHNPSRLDGLSSGVEKEHRQITPSPPASEQELFAYLEYLWATNDGCNLPCWWSIMPGETNIPAISSLLSTFGGTIKRSFTYPSGEIAYSVMGLYREGLPSSSITLYEDNRLVNRILISVDASNPLAILSTHADEFELRGIINLLGKPSRIWLEDFVPRDNYAYRLWIYFDESGTLISYSGSTTASEICPDLGAGNVFPGFYMFLQDPNFHLPLEQFVEFAGGGFNTQGVTQWSEERVEAFYKFLLSEQSCFKY